MYDGDLVAHPVFFQQNVKKSHPKISFTDVGKVLGERWNKMSGMLISGSSPSDIFTDVGKVYVLLYLFARLFFDWLNNKTMLDINKQ